MPSTNSRANILFLTTIIVVGALYLSLSIQTPGSDMNDEETPKLSTIHGLEFKLSQISQSPPSLLVTLKNNSPSACFTILKWNTPLDASALNLEVFKLVDIDTGETIPTGGLKVNRRMPPPREDLVTVAPDSEEAIEVVFNSPWMPSKKPAKYRVTIKGAFAGAWDRPGKDVQESELDDYLGSPFSGQSFVSNEVEMTVQ